ncbi:MAG: hypothetical protein V3U65_12735 [Granulosicoccaceae bacterium]
MPDDGGWSYGMMDSPVGTLVQCKSLIFLWMTCERLCESLTGKGVSED